MTLWAGVHRAERRRAPRPRAALLRMVLAALVASLALMAGTAFGGTAWAGTAPDPAATTEDRPITLYFFWGEGCPHCAAAEPFLESLQDRYPALVIRDFEVWNHPENQEPFVAMAAAFGFEPSGVPTIFLGKDYWVGFAEEPTGVQIEAAVAACAASGCPDAGAGVLTPAGSVEAPGGAAAPDGPASGPDDEPAGVAEPADGVLTLPLVGEVDTASQSLVVTTALIAFVDGFNPCSLWVLSVLLALTLRSGSRRTIVIIGLTFIAVTATVYALFIAGLFSVFTIASIAPWLQVVVALVAAAFAAVNIKDYFWFKRGLSFTIADERKPGIYKGIRRVLAEGDSVPALVGGTVVLAAGVSLVEFACTAGFPVLWTNLLAAHEVTAGVFVGLLLLYLVIYQLDELAVFGVAVVTLRANRLQERHGRVLKLVGGMLMLTLAVVMIVDPGLLRSVGTSLLVFGAAFAATLLVLLVHRVVLPRFGVVVGTEDLGPRPPADAAPRRQDDAAPRR